jgi:hypothetical protein
MLKTSFSKVACCRFMLLVAISLFIATMYGCASVQTVKSTYPSTINEFVIPSIGQTATANVGNTLISQGYVISIPAIKITETYRTEWMRNSGARAFPFFFDANTELWQIGEIQGVPIFVGPSSGGPVRPDGTQIGTPYGLGVKEDGIVKFVYLAGGVIPETEGRKIQFHKTVKTKTDERNFKLELLYNGKAGNQIFFTYREFKSEMARPAFSQEVRYSLDEDDLIGFKNLRIRVIEATNQGIKYKIIKPFH